MTNHGHPCLRCTCAYGMNVHVQNVHSRHDESLACGYTCTACRIVGTRVFGVRVCKYEWTLTDGHLYYLCSCAYIWMHIYRYDVHAVLIHVAVCLRKGHDESWCVCSCAYIIMYVCIHVCMYTNIYAYVRTHHGLRVGVRIYYCIFVYMYLCTCTYTHIYSHICIRHFRTSTCISVIYIFNFVFCHVLTRYQTNSKFQLFWWISIFLPILEQKFF